MIKIRDKFGRIIGKHPVILICAICSKSFKAYESEDKKYCSRKCYSEGIKRFHKGNKASHWKGGKKDVQCVVCKKVFQVFSSRSSAKFCSHKCYSEYRKGKHYPRLSIAKFGTISPNKGEKMPSITGENNYLWRGENVGYHALHAWVSRNRGKPTKCEHCGKVMPNTKQFHWANKDHQYHRDLNDFIRLCSSCHKKYDLKNGLSKH